MMDRETLKRELQSKFDKTTDNGKRRIHLTMIAVYNWIDEIYEAQGPDINDSTTYYDDNPRVKVEMSTDWEIRTDGKMQEHHPIIKRETKK